MPIGGLMTTLFATWRTLLALGAARAGAPLLLPHPVSVSTMAWLAAVVVVLAGAIVVSVRALTTSAHRLTIAHSKEAQCPTAAT